MRAVLRFATIFFVVGYSSAAITEYSEGASPITALLQDVKATGFGVSDNNINIMGKARQTGQYSPHTNVKHSYKGVAPGDGPGKGGRGGRGGGGGGGRGGRGGRGGGGPGGKGGRGGRGRGGKGGPGGRGPGGRGGRGGRGPGGKGGRGGRGGKLRC